MSAIESVVIRERLTRACLLYEDLVATLLGDDLARRIPGLPSNEIGQQLWCVIGARESYHKAIQAGSWQGFSCSLEWKATSQQPAVLEQLQRSRSSLGTLLDGLGKISRTQQELLLDLIEHEAQHHGQLIRYLYALKLTIPESWKKRYSLD
jgi:hypothetical protein